MVGCPGLRLGQVEVLAARVVPVERPGYPGGNARVSAEAPTREKPDVPRSESRQGASGPVTSAVVFLCVAAWAWQAGPHGLLTPPHEQPNRAQNLRADGLCGLTNPKQVSLAHKGLHQK